MRCRMLPPAGLLGGHSGLNIAEGRGNAVKMSAEILDGLMTQIPEARLSGLRAGDKRNALPREAAAVVYVSPPSLEPSHATRL
jgi:dipeptidase D